MHIQSNIYIYIYKESSGYVHMQINRYTHSLIDVCTKSNGCTHRHKHISSFRASDSIQPSSRALLPDL